MDGWKRQGGPGGGGVAWERIPARWWRGGRRVGEAGSNDNFISTCFFFSFLLSIAQIFEAYLMH